MDNPIINYRFAGIEIVHKHMEPMPPEGTINGFIFDVKVEVKVNAPNKIVLPVVTVTIKESSNKIELANFGVSCFFQIEDFEKYIVLDSKGLYTIPYYLDDAIRPIAVSTTRGIMFSELRGTYLNGAVLPIVNLTRPKID